MALRVTAELIPQLFWFRWQFPCLQLVDPNPNAPSPSPAQADSAQTGPPMPWPWPILPSSARIFLPQSTLPEGHSPSESESPFAIYAGWRRQGLRFTFVATDCSPIGYGDPEEPDTCHGVNLWLDTRDTRDIHRATKYCQRLQFLLHGRGRGKASATQVSVTQRPIPRAMEESRVNTAEILTRLTVDGDAGSYRLDVFLPNTALSGYDPDVNRRLGFCVQCQDPDRPPYWLAVGHPFPSAENPSLWPVLELREETQHASASPETPKSPAPKRRKSPPKST